MFNNLERYLKSLKHNSPDRGYYTNTTKSILAVHLENLEAGELSGWCHGFKVCKGAHYLGGYIGDDVSKGDWLKKQTEKWDNSNWTAVYQNLQKAQR